MTEVFGVPTIRVGLTLLILCVLIAAGFYLVSMFRDYADDDQQNPEEVLSNLREMHRKGDISDQEFRNIQANTYQNPVGPKSIDETTSQADSSAERQS